MTTFEKAPTDKGDRVLPPRRRAYRTPKLLLLGTVAELTAGGGTKYSDGLGPHV
jgi:hypothetical protein